MQSEWIFQYKISSQYGYSSTKYPVSKDIPVQNTKFHFPLSSTSFHLPLDLVKLFDDVVVAADREPREGTFRGRLHQLVGVVEQIAAAL
jgi:hypothetical protein